MAEMAGIVICEDSRLVCKSCFNGRLQCSDITYEHFSTWVTADLAGHCSCIALVYTPYISF